MLENLNELEQIGLAFISGLVAGQSLQEADNEVNEENNDNEKEIKVSVGKNGENEVEKIIKKALKDWGIE